MSTSVLIVIDLRTYVLMCVHMCRQYQVQISIPRMSNSKMSNTFVLIHRTSKMC